jgi:hypothetical protein
VILAVLLTLAGSARAQDDAWCRPTSVESQVRRWATAPFVKKRDLQAVTDGLRTRLARELLLTLVSEVDPRFEADVLALTERVQTLSVTQRKGEAGREVCVVVQMDKGGVVGELPSEVTRALLDAWTEPLSTFTRGRPLWIREVSLRDGAEPEVDDVVVPRVADLVRRHLSALPRWEAGAGPPPDELVTLDVRITPFPGHYGLEGVATDRSGASVSVGATLAVAWLGDVGARASLASREVRIDKVDGPTRVAAGKAFTLSWTSSNATSCAWAPMPGEVPVKGKVELRLADDTVLRLACTDGVRSVTREHAVDVFVPPPQVMVSADLSVVPVGWPATVRWESFAASSCALTVGGAAPVPTELLGAWSGPVPASGSLGVQVRCVNAAGDAASSSASVSSSPDAHLLVLRRTGDDWITVRVNGKAVELQGDAEATVVVGAGPTRVEVVPFMAEQASGALIVPAFTAPQGTLGVKASGEITCFDIPGCVVP